MNREQVKELFQFLISVYPNFMPETDKKLTQKVNAWASVMQTMDFDRVMARAREYAQENRFPPTIAEISAYAPPENETLKQMEQWRREAEQVPTETKIEFSRKMKQLIKEKSQ